MSQHLDYPPNLEHDVMSSLPLPRIVSIAHAVLPDPWRDFCEVNGIVVHQIHGYENPIGNQKIYAACGIVTRGIVRGEHVNKKKLVDSTSGNFAKGLLWAVCEVKYRWSAFPIERVVAVIPRSTPKEKRFWLECDGIELVVADNSLAAMELAAQLAKEHSDCWYTRQYWNPDNTASWRLVGEHIATQMPDLGAIAVGVGSGGSCSGIMPILSQRFSRRTSPRQLLRVAVVVEDDEVDGIPNAVDGVRNRTSLAPGSLPWWNAVDSIRFVTEERARINAAALWRQNEICRDANCVGGYSTGFALEGLMLALRERQMQRALDELRGPDGRVQVAYLAPDRRDPYRSKFAKHGIHFS